MSKDPRVLICGGRDFNRRHWLKSTLDGILEARVGSFEMVLAGCARGTAHMVRIATMAGVAVMEVV